MALKAVIDETEHAALADALKSEYKQREDGKFQLDVISFTAGDTTIELANTSSLRKALAEERTNAKTAKAALSKYEGLDAEEARRALEVAAELKGMKLDDKIQLALKARTDELVAAHQKEQAKLTGEMKELTGQLEQHVIISQAAKAISENKGSVELLMPHVLRHARMRKTDQGRFIAEVIDADGNVRADGNGASMTIAGLIAEMRNDDKYARAFDASGASGSGASAGSGTDKGANTGNNSGAGKTITSKGGHISGVKLEDISTGKVKVRS